jgi:hypothetical protein
MADGKQQIFGNILAYFKVGLINAIYEGINSMIQAAKRKARGFNALEGFICMIYLVAGKLWLDVINPFLALRYIYVALHKNWSRAKIFGLTRKITLGSPALG